MCLKLFFKFISIPIKLINLLYQNKLNGLYLFNRIFIALNIIVFFNVKWKTYVNGNGVSI